MGYEVKNHGHVASSLALSFSDVPCGFRPMVFVYIFLKSHSQTDKLISFLHPMVPFPWNQVAALGLVTSWDWSRGGFNVAHTGQLLVGYSTSCFFSPSNLFFPIFCLCIIYFKRFPHSYLIVLPLIFYSGNTIFINIKKCSSLFSHFIFIVSCSCLMVVVSS